MALGDPYAEVGPLIDQYGTEHAQRLFELVNAASRAVEAFCKRQFNKTTTATARRFQPVDWHRLPVDDFHTAIDFEVEVDGTVWDVADLELRPWNGTVDGQPGWPYFDLVAVNRSWPATAAINVTAQWGWDAVPEGVRQTTLDMAAVMFESGGSNVQSESITGYSVTYQSMRASEVPPEMERVVQYRRKRFGLA